MENLSLKVARIVGPPSLRHWPQVYTFFPEDSEKQEKRGMFLSVLTLTLEEDELQITALGKEILLRLQEEYYGEIQAPVLEKLVEATKKVKEEFSLEGQSLEMITVVLLGKALYLVNWSNGEIWLKRQSQLGRVLGGGETLKSASGFLEEGDLLIVGTETFFSIVGEGVLRPALEANEVGEMVESLLPLVHSKESATRAAALVGKVEKSVAQEEEQEVVEEVKVADLPPSDQKETPLSPKKNWLGLVKARLPKVTFPPVPKGRLEDYKKKRMFFAIACILMILLSASIFFGGQKRQQSQLAQKYEKDYQETLSLLDQGQASLSYNPGQSKELFLQAKSKFEGIKSLNAQPERTEELETKVVAALSQVFKEYKADEVPVFLDLTLVAGDARGDKLSLTDTTLLILDQTKDRVLSVDLGRKSSEVLAGGDTFTQAKILTSSKKTLYVLDENGISQLKIKSKKLQKVLGKDEGWGQILQAKVFNDNLYLLDPGKEEIWRYSISTESLGTRQKWLKEPLNISSAVSFSIDGAVWLLTKDGKILKFAQGAPSTFSMTGLAKELLNPTTLYTDEALERLYILDKGNRRLVALAKSGEYKSEYLWDGLVSVDDFVIIEGGKKALLLGGSKIFSMDLK